MKPQDEVLGTFVPFNKLDSIEQQVVSGTWQAAEFAYVPLSNFPVGCVLQARNAQGDTKLFTGCNVENRVMSATICAERNAITTAVANGYTELLKIAFVCKNYQGPGSNSCGLCRQVIVEFGKEATVYCMHDADSGVRKFLGKELLPAAGSALIYHSQMTAQEKRLARRLSGLVPKSYVPYSNQAQASIFIATNENGVTRHFPGVPMDNASYGGSAPAEAIAMRAAKSQGYDRNVTLAVSVELPQVANPVEGESLQVLREFGPEATVLLFSNNTSLVRTSLTELLPESFGPHSLH